MSTSGGSGAVTGITAGTGIAVSGGVPSPTVSVAPNFAVEIGAGKNPLATAATVLTSSSVTGDAFDRFQIEADGTMNWGPGTADPTTSAGFQISVGHAPDPYIEFIQPGVVGASLTLFSTSFSLTINGKGLAIQNTGHASGIASNGRASGALPTLAVASGIATQVVTDADAHLHVPVTFTLATGTCQVELSPDNVTYSTLVTLAGGATGAVLDAAVVVPAGWYVRMTVTNATLGTGTWY